MLKVREDGGGCYRARGMGKFCLIQRRLFGQAAPVAATKAEGAPRVVFRLPALAVPIANQGRAGQGREGN